MKKLFEVSFVVCFLFIFVGACGDAKELYDCASLCETYGDCASELGVDIDEVQCTDDCEDKADTDKDFAQKADACVECLDQTGTCSDNFPCVDECIDVVPEVVF